MSNKIIVTWTNNKFTSNTDSGYHQQYGLGMPVEETDNPSEIIFTTEQLQTKLSSINKILSDPNNGELFYDAPKKDSSILKGHWARGEFYAGTLSKIKSQLADALFDAPNRPTDPETYFKFTTTTDNLNQHNDVAFRELQATVKGYKILIEAILNKEAGLARAFTDVNDATSYVAISNPITISIPSTLSVTQFQVPLQSILQQAAKNLIIGKTLAFFDESREYKTLLDFGNDTQYVAESWRVSPSNSNAIQLRLSTPLNSSIQVYDSAFITREIAKSIVDTVDVLLSPEIDITPYLRPRNTHIKEESANKKYINNVTLSSLNMGGGTVSGSNISYDNDIFRRWYTADFNSSELNIDFSNYSNFVHFGSARNRIDAFAQKLSKIEQLKAQTIADTTSSVAGYGTYTYSPTNATAQANAIEIENVIRNFDPYEQFLYYTTASVAYSASVDYVTGDVEYNSSSSWPKYNDGTLYSPISVVTSSNAWYVLQSGIADRYDANNPNYLVTHLPRHIQEDAESNEFLIFVSMIGHMVDNIKVYIDQFPNIYSTHPDPYTDLTMDQVYEVASSFGLNLPNVYSLESLESFIQTNDIDGAEGSRTLVSETWKRFLHSMVYMSKLKGSRTAFDVLLNTYGINSPILQAKETTYPSEGNFISSDELTYGVKFDSASYSYIKVPFVSASINTATVQMRFAPTIRQSASILTGNTNWAVNVVPHPTASRIEYGRIEIVSSSIRIASSSYFPLYSEDYTTIMLRSQSSGIDFDIIQTDGSQILYQYSASANLSSTWAATSFIYVGGSGSAKTNNFGGIVDEVRVWGESTTNDRFTKFSYDPGSYDGNTYTSAYSSLYALLTFAQPYTSITSSLVNDSPLTTIPSFTTYGLTTGSYIRLLRTIRQDTPIVGSSIYTNNKINIAAPPTFTKGSLDSNGQKVLSRRNSIVTVSDKQHINSGKNIVSFAISPTDFINQNILRTMGPVDVNNIIGNPADIFNTNYPELDSLNRTYNQYYRETINSNQYIDFFKNVVQAPSEFAEEIIPARAKLLNGVVIQSPILHRNKIVLTQPLNVDGTDTRILDNYTNSGSLDTDVGAFYTELSYDIQEQIVPTSYATNYETVTETSWDDSNITIDINNYVMVESSTPPNELPPARRALQYFNGTTLASSSIFDDNSGVLNLDGTIDYMQSDSTIDTGYARSIYNRVNQYPYEVNTLTPFYDIPPTSDFNDVGTTSYFHKNNGLYQYRVASPYKKTYLAKLERDPHSTKDPIYAPVSLLPSGSIPLAPGRYDSTFPYTQTYTTASTYVSEGVISVANIFSLYGLSGINGLRIRLYRTEESRAQDDVFRSFYSVPTGDHGVLFDAIMDADTNVFPYVLMQAIDSFVYYRITSDTSISNGTVHMYYFAYEPINLVPIGYLPRHYKFSRENSTAIKRRNYIGCLQTQDTTTDSNPPFQTIFAPSTTITVASAGSSDGGLLNKSINFGGGGTLNVD